MNLNMRYGLIGDVHGTDLSELEMKFDEEEIDALVCLGDFDQPKTIHQFMDLERKYKEEGKQVIVVPGNHDHAILTNLSITSGTLKSQGYESSELHKMLMGDDEARGYVERLLARRKSKATLHGVGTYLDREKFGNLYKMLVVHGGLSGSLFSYSECLDEIKDLWIRLSDGETGEPMYKGNFSAMNERGYTIMIRGHDHESLYLCQDSSGEIEEIFPIGHGSRAKFTLSKDETHVINPGALVYGNYAVIDTSEEKPVLEFRNLLS